MSKGSGKKGKERKCYIVYTVSDDGRERRKEFRTRARSEEQAVGFYVSIIIKKPWEKENFFATLATARDCKNCPKDCKLRDLEEKEDQDPPDLPSPPSPKLPPPPKQGGDGIQLDLNFDL